jgi:hypothetical protein
VHKWKNPLFLVTGWTKILRKCTPNQPVAIGPAEHKIIRTRALFEKNHHHRWTQRRGQNHICP